MENKRKKNDHIQKLIAEGEHQMQDFKFEISDARKIAKTLSAFANTEGGRLLIGVKDNGVISGIRSEEEKHMIQTAAELYCQPQVDYYVKEWEINGKTVLEVIVPKSKKYKHKAPDHCDKYKVYIRVNDQNLLADTILLKIWKQQKNSKPVQMTFDDNEMLMLKYFSENKTFTLENFMKDTKLKKKEAEQILVNYILIGMLTMTITEKVTYFALQEDEK